MRAAAYALAAVLLTGFVMWLVHLYETVPGSEIVPVLLGGIAAAAITCIVGIAIWASWDRRAEREMDDGDTEEHLGPLRTGGTRVERRLRALLASRGQLTRRVSRARHRRAAAGVHVEPPLPPLPPEPGVAHMPVPEPVTRPDSEPPAAFAEPEPEPVLSTNTIWDLMVIATARGERL